MTPSLVALLGLMGLALLAATRLRESALLAQ
jgi:MYXO-CTERM domain-containing protein